MLPERSSRSPSFTTFAVPFTPLAERALTFVLLMNVAFSAPSITNLFALTEPPMSLTEDSVTTSLALTLMIVAISKPSSFCAV